MLISRSGGVRCGTLIGKIQAPKPSVCPPKMMWGVRARLRSYRTTLPNEFPQRHPRRRGECGAVYASVPGWALVKELAQQLSLADQLAKLEGDREIQ